MKTVMLLAVLALVGCGREPGTTCEPTATPGVERCEWVPVEGCGVEFLRDTSTGEQGPPSGLC